jgi:hypothetical protein
MSNFTCQAVETKLHRHVVDIWLGPIMVLLTPKDDKTEAEAIAVAEFINGHVREMVWAKMLEGFELASEPAAELAEKEPR